MTPIGNSGLKSAAPAREKIDWQGVRRWLAESRHALDGAAEADASRLDEVYRRRAKELSARSGRRGAERAATPTLVVGLGEERYGIPLLGVREVGPLASWTPLPGGPEALLGVANVRGEIHSLVDLARLLGCSGGGSAAAGEEQTGAVVMARRGDHQLALRVDQVECVAAIAAESLVPLDDHGAAAPHIRGVAPGKIIVLDMEKLFALRGL